MDKFFYKKDSSVIILTTTIFSCNSNSEKKSNSESTKNYVQVGVLNVNGNIPDTANAIKLTYKLDSVGKHKDSAKQSGKPIYN